MIKERYLILQKITKSVSSTNNKLDPNFTGYSTYICCPLSINLDFSFISIYYICIFTRRLGITFDIEYNNGHQR